MNEQLTFLSMEKDTGHRMQDTGHRIQDTEAKANVTADKSEKPRYKHQASEILRLLKAGPVWTNDLRRIAAQYNARIRELREQLRLSGMTVDCTFHGKDGNNRYEIKPFHGSNYEAYLMSKQKV